MVARASRKASSSELESEIHHFGQRNEKGSLLRLLQSLLRLLMPNTRAIASVIHLASEILAHIFGS